ncbi:hypothetical protein H9Y04_31645 [Streptomyces sp. TRM66268-LWL]|uniref:Uncharacterized protein n=1 Tax=Streptomyces polyasparticus TaxID=2767826 RepID=A0ABR7SNN3_9ACTN|nr:hypothetical protein [Streptomyces polyasparticus]
MRELLSRQAGSIRTHEAPLDAIERRGRRGQRLRVAVTASALAVVIAVPVGAYAVGSGDNTPVAKAPSPTSPTKVGVPPAHTTPTPTPSGPAAPGSPEQLADGITYEQAADGLEKCLAYHREMDVTTDEDLRIELGKAEDYRILLAHRMTGDDNAPGDGFWVAATTDKPRPNRVICRIVDGKSTGISSGSEELLPEFGPVHPDINAGKLNQQTIITSGGWRMPYRWGSIGQFASEVERVTVTYGDETVEASLDHGWFAATGILQKQPTTAPHIKGYDADGKQIYDSTQDKFYEHALPKS